MNNQQRARKLRAVVRVRKPRPSPQVQVRRAPGAETTAADARREMIGIALEAAGALSCLFAVGFAGFLLTVGAAVTVAMVATWLSVGKLNGFLMFAWALFAAGMLELLFFLLKVPLPGLLGGSLFRP